MILDKAKMAHDWVMKYGKVDSNYNRENTVQLAWDYADAMQAEADKRVVKLPDVFFDTKQNEEWQPDWSQAPDDKITHWTMEKDKRYSWWIGEPKKDSQNHYESIENANCSFYGDAPSFNYQGIWQDSLRKRPQ